MGVGTWSRVKMQSVGRLPNDMDGLVAYKIKADDRKVLLQRCRDGRRWKKDSETKWVNYEKVRYKSCSGSFECPNLDCEHRKSTGNVNKLKFSLKDNICHICGTYGTEIPCPARKYIATFKKTAHVYHYGKHTCQAKQIIDNSELVSQALMVSPTVKPSAIQAGVVLNALRARKPWIEVKREAMKATDKKKLSNEKVKQQKKLNPYGFGFEAVKDLKQYTDMNDK